MSRDNLEAFADSIAIIGMSGRFPGADDVDTLWHNLCNGIESITRFSEQELRVAGVPESLLRDPNYVKARGIIEGFDLFDAAFFGFTPREATILDPQQRLFLECAWEALEDAGYNTKQFSGRIGVFAGAGANNYLLFNLATDPKLLQSVDFYQTLLGNEKDFLATRVAYKLDLRGPCITIQTACSTSLVAVSLACQSLLSYQSDITLAGGVAISIPHRVGYLYHEGSILSPDGHCRAFDAQAKGTVDGSGAGVVVLKRLADALEDGDEIYAVIRGTAINNDGARKMSYTAPGVEGQAEAIAEAYAMADITAETISYVEAHGTATPLGDPVEVAALTRAFQETTKKRGFCALGSIKTNIGHLDVAAGVAGLIKTALALKNAMLPASLFYREPNPQINFPDSPFYVNNETMYWEQGSHPRRAGVSSFGVGGTNAHVVLEEAPPRQPSAPGRNWQLLVLSARTPVALKTTASNLATHLRKEGHVKLADVAYTLQVGRNHFSRRRALVCRSIEEAIRLLEIDDSTGSCDPELTPEIVFMFPGQGVKCINAARTLYDQIPLFRERLDSCAASFAKYLGVNILDTIYPSEGEEQAAAERLQQTNFSQPALFTLAYSLADTLINWGLRPTALIGHSLGEYVAATVAGVLSLDDAIRLVAARAQLMQQTAPGAMLAVSLSPTELLQRLSPPLTIAVVNSANLCVVSGSPEEIEQLECRLAAEAVSYRRLKLAQAFHSPLMEPVLDEFAEVVRSITLRPPQIPFAANLTGNWIRAEEAINPMYWVNHLRHTVQFAQGLHTVVQGRAPILFELGPGDTLCRIVRTNGIAAKAIPTLSEGETTDHSDWSTLLTAIGMAWAAGVEVNWQAIQGGGLRHRVRLPTYPFERQRYWLDAPMQERNTEVTVNLEGWVEPEITIQHTSMSTNATTLLSTTEQLLINLFKEVLGVTHVGLHDDFFSLGGNSLSAAQCLAHIRAKTSLALPLKTFLATPTVWSIVHTLTQLRDGASLEVSEENLKHIELQEATLDTDIVPTQQLARVLSKSNRVLLTGATGFVGAYLLAELLQRTQAEIICLVRAQSSQEGLQRIIKHLKLFDLWEPAFSKRITALHGDLNQPLLGLSSEEFHSLASSIDAIYHNGAVVNFTYPYHILKGANVFGTQEILRLACRVRTKPVHYVSTVAVFETMGYHWTTCVDEETISHRFNDLPSGYAKSKYIAEKLVITARERGLPVTVYRLGNVTGDLRAGRCNTTDYLFCMFKSCLQLELAPQVNDLIDMNPVDVVSKAIVALSLEPSSLGNVFHLVHPNPLPIALVFDYLQGFGYRLQPVSWEEWRARLLTLSAKDDDNALFPFIPWIVEQPSPGLPILYDNSTTRRRLEALGITYPPLNEHLLRHYVERLVKDGFFPLPIQRSTEH